MKFKQHLSKLKFLTLSILLIVASIFCFNFNFSYKAFAASTYNAIETVENAFSNSKFETNTSSKYPFAPSGYDVSTNSKDEDGNDNNGVINLKDDKYKESYKYLYPDEPNQYVLMIKTNAEYKTNSAYTLQADSHYEISALVYTDVDDSVAAVTLYNSAPKDGETSVLCAVNNISSYRAWKEVKFYVSTSEFSTLGVKLGLSGNGHGVALFDNLTVRKLSESVLNEWKSAASWNPDCYVDKRINDGDYIVKSDVLSLANNVFRKTSPDAVDVNYTTSANDSEVTDGTNTTAMVISHQEKAFSKFTTTDNYLSFEQNNLYQVSIVAKALELNGQVSFTLTQTSGYLEAGEEAKTQTANISSSANNSMNGYTKTNFFVKAPCNKDVDFKLEISFGTEDSEASGKVYISCIKVCKINYSTFNNGTNKVDFTSSDADGMLANGEFNSMQVDNALKPYPATATSWTVERGNGSGSQYYGIINTKPANYTKMVSDNNLQNIRNFNPSSQNNNVLMLYNDNTNSLTYTSENKNITAGESKNAFCFKIYPINANVKVSIAQNIEGEYFTLATKTYQPKANLQWIDGALFLKTPYQNMNIAVQITLETNGWGACFVDDVSFDSTVSDSTFALGDGVDLSNFFATDNLSEYYLSSAKYFVGAGTLLNNTAGIVNLGNSNLSSIIAVEDQATLSKLKSLAGDNKNVLTILALEESFFALNSKIGFSLSANSYYKFSIDVLTVLDEQDEAQGASISLSSFEESFSNISTNGWETYTFYIKPDADAANTTLSLGIGSAEQACAGKVFFGNLQFEKLSVTDDDAFNEIAKAGPRTLVVNNVKTDENEDDTDDATDNSTSSGSINWWYFVPTILFVAAIVICIVGIMARKVKWKKPSRKVKNAYDRDKTVSVQYYTRKATQERELKVRELQKEIDGLSAEREKYEDEYKHDLSTMRELKIKRASAAEISKLQKDMNKNRKMASAIGLNINKLENELRYTKSSAYLNAQIRKLSNEKSNVQAKETSTEQQDDQPTNEDKQ